VGSKKYRHPVQAGLVKIKDKDVNMRLETLHISPPDKPVPLTCRFGWPG